MKKTGIAKRTYKAVAVALLLLPGISSLTAQEALLGQEALTAQETAYWIYFIDKGTDAENRLASASAADLGISAEAMRRRAGGPGMYDLPLFADYVDAVSAAGARLRARSRWLNALSAMMTPAQKAGVEALPFVLSVRPVRLRKSVLPSPAPAMPALSKTASYSLDYGLSLQQAELINVPKVHDVWIDGTDIIVGVLDVGFRWRTHEALKNLRVLGEYDFINGDTNTENEPGDPWGQDSHGTVTFSTLAGFMNGLLIGPAFNASFYLAKTEVIGSETQIEEDYWTEGIEWLEANGASVASSSLGYTTFDDGGGYRWENGDFDGRTAVTTRAAVQAMRLGVVVVTAVGNDGSGPGTLIAPSDADTVIAVGAVDFANQIAGFSSRGPTNDSRIKPDLMAAGVQVFSATKQDDGSYGRSNGTSMSTPLVAGVAALIRSARPELTPVQVRDALRETADRAASPSSAHGWGTIDAWKALLYHGMVISTNPNIFWNEPVNTIGAYVLSPHPVRSSEVTLHYTVDGGAEQIMSMAFASGYAALGAGSGLFLAQLPELPLGAGVHFYITASDDLETRSSPYGAPERYHEFKIGESRGIGDIRIVPEGFALHQNYPNPFSPSGSTMIDFDVPAGGSDVLIEVYDVLGRRMAGLVQGYYPGGTYSISFSGPAYASGAYIYIMKAGEHVFSRNLMIVR